MRAATDSRQVEMQRFKPAEVQPETVLNPHLRTAAIASARPDAERQQADPGYVERSMRGSYERLQCSAQAETNIRESRTLPVCERSS